MIFIVKTVSHLVYLGIVISSFSLHAAHPAASAQATGGCESTQSMHLAGIVAVSASVQNTNLSLPRLPIAGLKAMVEAREKHLAQLNDRLKKANKDTWNEDKKAIQDAVENYDVHPDDVQLPLGILSSNKPPLAVACSRHDTSELPFIQFLLERGAGVNYTSYLNRSFHAIEDACTVDIAALLMRYGARPDYATLFYTALYRAQYSPELVAFYLDQGVVIKAAAERGSRGFNFLMCDLLSHCIIYGATGCDVHDAIQAPQPIHPAGALSRRVEILLQAGAPLSTPNGTWTIPAKVKERIGYARNGQDLLGENALKELLKIEQILKKHSDYRHDGIKEDLKLCEGTNGAVLLLELQAMIIDYFIKPEPRYEQLLGS